MLPASPRYAYFTLSRFVRAASYALTRICVAYQTGILGKHCFCITGWAASIANRQCLNQAGHIRL